MRPLFFPNKFFSFLLLHWNSNCSAVSLGVLVNALIFRLVWPVVLHVALFQTHLWYQLNFHSLRFIGNQFTNSFEGITFNSKRLNYTFLHKEKILKWWPVWSTCNSQLKPLRKNCLNSTFFLFFPRFGKCRQKKLFT